jgi:hypothetical protein
MRNGSSRLRVVVTGLVAQHPRLGGVAWDYLQYVLGLASLGHEVTYLEDSGQWPYGLGTRPARRPHVVKDPTANVAHLAKLMERFGLANRWAYRFPLNSRWYGLSKRERREVTATADLLIDVSGALEHPDEHRGRGRQVYIDTDPVFTQLKLAAGASEFSKRVAAYDRHFSFGERVQELAIPTPYRWRPTRQPVVLSEWQPSSRPRKAFTTVLSWTSYPPLRFRGKTYGQKDVEFGRFLSLPSRAVPIALEVAIAGTRHADWEGEAAAPPPPETLRGAGSRVVDAYHVCADLDRYRSYIEASRGEWSIQKNGYVRGQPGWFSGRSACYLAAGRPVVVQDTGLAGVLPTGDGLLCFRSVEEAEAALREVDADYDRHAAAARALAAAYFDADLVLPPLLEEALGSDA